MKKIDLTGRRYMVGIDPSFTNMGICVYDPETNKMLLWSGEFLDAVDWLGENVNLRECVIVLENPALDSPVFKGLSICRGTVLQYGDYMKKIGAKQWPIPTKVDWSSKDGVASKISIALTYAQKVGQNKAAGNLTLKLLERHKVPVFQVAPSDRERADKKRVPVGIMVMPTKTTQAQFKTLTGYAERSNEHKRDAATLVWGKDFSWFANRLLMGVNDKAKKTRKKSMATKKEKPASQQTGKVFNVLDGSGQKVEKVVVNGRTQFKFVD